MRHKFLLRFAALAFSAFLLIPPAGSKSRISSKEAAELAAKLGPQVVKQLRAEMDVESVGSELPPQSRNQAVEKMLQDYATMRGRYASARNAGEWTSLGIQGGAGAVVLFAGPQASITVPTILVAAALTTTIEIGNDELERVGTQRARALLKTRKSEILRTTGLTYPELQKDPARVRALFNKSVGVFKDLRDRVGADSEQWRIAQEMLVDTLATTSELQLNAIQVNSNRIDTLADSFADFANEIHLFEKQIGNRLTNVENSMMGIEIAVTELNDSVAELDKRVSTLERDQSIVADFVFDSMPAAEKVDALRNQGFLAARFQCENGGNDCEGAKLKSSLIDRFEKQAKLESLVSDVTLFTGTLGDVHTIAGNLGINSPELTAAVNFGNTAASAFSQFASGNYLGAVASITGLFGKRSDPDAERFKILMRYLDRQFSQVNTRLDNIVENQAMIMEGITVLSKQLRQGFLQIDQSLSRLEFEQERMSGAVRQLIWNDWKSCNAVHNYAFKRMENGRYEYIDSSTGLFLSESSIRKLIGDIGESSVLPCIQIMQNNFASLSAIDRFGSFIDVNWVIDSKRLDAAKDTALSESSGWQSRLQEFESSIFRPARMSAGKFIEADKAVTPAELFSALVRPITSTDDWVAAFHSSRETTFECWSDGHREQRMFSLLCMGESDNPNVNALSLLDRPIIADAVNDIADWVLVVSQLADFRDQSNGKWLSIADLVNLSKQGELDFRNSPGEKLIESAIGVLDTAIASYGMIYGPVSADVILREVATNGLSKEVVQITQNNPYVQNNFTQMYLEYLYKKANPGRVNARPELPSYRAAYELATSQTTAKFLLLKSLFGIDHEFERSADGELKLVLEYPDGSVELKLPPPGAFSEGRLHMPPKYFELLAKREKLADRLFSYRMLDELNEQERVAAAFALLQ